MSLEMKYFVLKPKGNSNFAAASRVAMIAYADSIRNTDSDLARQLTDWANNETEATNAAGVEE